MVDSTQDIITAADFFKIADASDERMELIQGEIFVMGTPTPTYQEIVGEIYMLLRTVAQLLGGRVFVAPLEVVLDDENTVQPDVMYLAADSRCTVGEKRLHGTPELVVDVLSPSTAKRDRKEKHALYQQHQVAEYWMVDPEAAYIEVWRTENDSFNRVGVFGADETFISPVLGEKAIEVKHILRV